VPGGFINFFDSSTAGNGTFVIQSGMVGMYSSADHGTFTFEGGNLTNNSAGGYLQVGGSATLASASFTLGGGTVADAGGAYCNFLWSATCDHATITLNGGSASGATGGTLNMQADGTLIPSCGNATFIINGGSNGGGGGTFYLSYTQFSSAPDGGAARLELFGNGTLDMSQIFRPFTTGSLEGNGIVSLGSTKLTIGTRNANTTFSGLIQDGGIIGGTGGSFSKVGTGTLTLTGANTYTGATTVNGGTLLINNRQGSATGTGAVSVGAATLGGRGIIAGSVTLGNFGTSSFLAPAGGRPRQVTLTIQNSLTFQPTATYTCTFKARGTQIRADEVIANGVTVNSATIDLQGTIEGTLVAGTVVTVISNTSASPISGTFNNLPDGAIIAVSGTNFQADYEGGDGNDLTLTVVP
jgi:autotransporter-associated beta strand protein